MIEHCTVKQRLIMFIKHLGIGQKKFEDSCGLSNGYVNNIRKSLSTEKIQRIISVYPQLNRDWLVYGDGDMIITPKSEVQIIGDGSNNTNAHHITVNKQPCADNSITAAIIDQLAEKDRQLAEKDAQITNLISIITNQEAQLRSLLAQRSSSAYRTNDDVHLISSENFKTK